MCTQTPKKKNTREIGYHRYTNIVLHTQKFYVCFMCWARCSVYYFFKVGNAWLTYDLFFLVSLNHIHKRTQILLYLFLHLILSDGVLGCVLYTQNLKYSTWNWEEVIPVMRIVDLCLLIQKTCLVLKENMVKISFRQFSSLYIQGQPRCDPEKASHLTEPCSIWKKVPAAPDEQPCLYNSSVKTQTPR